MVSYFSNGNGAVVVGVGTSSVATSAVEGLSLCCLCAQFQDVFLAYFMRSIKRRLIQKR